PSPSSVEIEFLDHAFEAGERAVEHLHRIADLIVDLDLLLRRGGRFFLGVEHAMRLGIGDRLRLAVGAEEACHLGRVLDQVIDVVVERQLGEDVAGHELAFGLDLLAALDLGDRLGRDLNRFDQLLEPEALGFAQDRVADLVLETGISVDDVPAGHGITLEIPQPSRPRRNLTIALKAESTPKKKTASMAVMISTMMAVV